VKAEKAIQFPPLANLSLPISLQNVAWIEVIASPLQGGIINLLYTRVCRLMGNDKFFKGGSWLYLGVT